MFSENEDPQDVDIEEEHEEESLDDPSDDAADESSDDDEQRQQDAAKRHKEQRLRKRAQKAEAETRAYKEENEKLRKEAKSKDEVVLELKKVDILLEEGVPADLREFITGSTEEEIRKQALKLKKRFSVEEHDVDDPVEDSEAEEPVVRKVTAKKRPRPKGDPAINIDALPPEKQMEHYEKALQEGNQGI